MANWLKKYRARIIFACAIVAAVIILSTFWIGHASPVCKVLTKQALANGYSASGWDCFDFWFYRYQTLIIGFPSLIVASLAARAAYKGLRQENARVAWEYNASAADARQKSRDLVKKLTRIATVSTNEYGDFTTEKSEVEQLLSDIITLIEKAGFVMQIDTERLRKLAFDVIWERHGAQLNAEPRSPHIRAEALKQMLEKIWEIESMFMPPKNI